MRSEGPYDGVCFTDALEKIHHGGDAARVNPVPIIDTDAVVGCLAPPPAPLRMTSRKL